MQKLARKHRYGMIGPALAMIAAIWTVLSLPQRPWSVPTGEVAQSDANRLLDKFCNMPKHRSTTDSKICISTMCIAPPVKWTCAT